jgi:hypothetical protein
VASAMRFRWYLVAAAALLSLVIVFLLKKGDDIAATHTVRRSSLSTGGGRSESVARGGIAALAPSAPPILQLPTEDPPQFPPPPLPRYKERAAGEWDGMLVDLATTPPCESTAGCGLARACLKGICTACTVDAECGSDEGCVRDHCVLRSRIGCRRNSDCGVGNTCMLSGYSPDPRGNHDMGALCVSPQSGSGKAELMKKQATVDDPAESGRQVAFKDELARARTAFIGSNAPAQGTASASPRDRSAQSR